MYKCHERLPGEFGVYYSIRGSFALCHLGRSLFTNSKRDFKEKLKQNKELNDFFNYSCDAFLNWLVEIVQLPKTTSFYQVEVELKVSISTST